MSFFSSRLKLPWDTHERRTRARVGSNLTRSCKGWEDELLAFSEADGRRVWWCSQPLVLTAEEKEQRNILEGGRRIQQLAVTIHLCVVYLVETYYCRQSVVYGGRQQQLQWVCTQHSTVLYVAGPFACTATVLCLYNTSWDGLAIFRRLPIIHSSVAPSPDAADATGRHTFFLTL